MIIQAWPCAMNDSRVMSVLHSVNLAVLAKFYDLTNASIMSHDLFDFSELKEPKPIEWPIFEADSERLLAADKAAGYSLEKLAISMQNDSVVLHSSSEALLHDLISVVLTSLRETVQQLV